MHHSSHDHARHWHFLASAGDPQEQMHQIYQELISGSQSLMTQHEETMHLIDRDGQLRCGLLLHMKQPAAVHPLVVDGFDWPLEICEVLPWPDGCQGHVIASCRGAQVCLYDTHYFLHQHRYRSGEPLQFTVAGLAYSLFGTVFEDEQQAVSLAETKAYFPVSQEEGGEVDEFKFMSHVEAVRETDFHGLPLLVYTVTIALPDDFPMRLDLFAHRSSCEKQFAVGDPISGFAWLFGKFRDEPAD